jgi:ribosome-associated toxin RatA of RatAB toxin-antitoxin module
MKYALTLVMVMLLTMALVGSAAAGSVTSKLTAAELERVKKGEIILKNDISDGKESGAGIGYGVFHCKLDRFWEIVFDYPDYKRMFPPTDYAKVIKREPSGKFLTECQMKFMGGLYKINYTSFNIPTPDKLRLDFGLDKSYPHERFKEMGGYWQLEEIGEDTYIAEYKVDVELNLPAGFKDIVQKIVNSLAGKDLPKMFESIRKEIVLRDKK